MDTFLDDYSRYVVAYFMAHTFEVVDNFIKSKLIIENQLIKKIKGIRTDDSGEYINKRVCRSVSED